MIRQLALLVVLVVFVIVTGCASGSSVWRSEGPPNQKVQVKQIEFIGVVHDLSGRHVGIADPVIVSFSTSGPTERRKPLAKLPAPTLRLRNVQVSYLNPELNKTLQDALNINADPTTLQNEVWQVVKAKYPYLNYLAITLFDVSETYKISEEAHHLPYMWSSSIVCRTIIVDLNTRQVISEWKQHVVDRSTWTDACASPEELARYLVPVGDTYPK